MMSHKTWITLTLVVLVTAPHHVIPAPFSTPQQSCATTCFKNVDSSHKIAYVEGKSYTYTFESNIETKLEQTTAETSRIHIKGQAILGAQSSCDFILTVRNVTIQSPNGQRVLHASTQLEGSSVRFGYQNGKVEGLCTTANDPTWSTNVKRSIVSLLQNTASNTFGDSTVIEVDISGRCPTEYTFSGEKYTKTRNLTNCSYRNGGEWISHGVPYSVSSNINSDPLLKSTLTCDQIIADGIIKSVECIEQHQLEPLTQASSPESSILQTLIKSTLLLDSVADGLSQPAKSTLKESITVPSSILFDHTDSTSSIPSRIGSSNTVQIVQQLCAEIKSGTVSSAVPGLYLQLGKSMRSTTVDELENIYSTIENDEACPFPMGREKLRKLFIDAAARVSTSDTIQFTVNRIVQGKVDKITEKLFAHHTSFASKPSSAALSAMFKLISTTNFDSNFILASTALAYQYCTQTNPDCLSDSDYNTLTAALAESVEKSCHQQMSEKSVQKTITYIQALGNLNRLPESAVIALSTCLESADAPNRIKLRALDAFRRDPCVAQLKETALKMFQDKSQSSEVRISGYLASIRCLVQDDVGRLQVILDEEESNQVGSFVLSHIQNQLRNESPDSRQLKRVFKQFKISKTFPFDPRRFSTNFGFSKFDSSENLGISTEANIIYSQDHFVPKTAQANLTGYFFGRGYNLLEFGLHVENFEHLLEKYFGPSTGFTEPSNNVITKDPNGSESANINLNDIEKAHVAAGGKIKEKFGKIGTIDLYVRELGTSVYTNSFTQNDFMTLPQFSYRNAFLAVQEQLIQGAGKNFKFDFTEPATFIDEQIIYSTIAGLPLNLQVQGSSVLSLELEGNIDIPAIVKSGKTSSGSDSSQTTDIKSRILPSAATILTASINVGSGSFIESGLQLEAKVHSSTGIDLDLVRQEGKFELKFNIPEEKIQIVDLRSELFWTETIGDELEVKTPLISKWDTKASTVIDDKCVNSLSAVFGLRFCVGLKMAGHENSKSPIFPLAGTSLLTVSIEKTEPTMEGYYFKAESALQDTTDQTFSIVFDTPGSKTVRKITANGLLHQSDTSTKFGIDVVSPWQKARIDYQLWKELTLKGAEIRVGIDQSIFSAIVQLKETRFEEANEILYEPLISYSVPGSTFTLLDGKVRNIKDGIEVDLNSDGPTRALKGKINGLIQLEQQDLDNRLFSLTGIQIENGVLGKIHLGGTVKLQESLSALSVKTLYGPNLESNCAVDISSEYTFNREEGAHVNKFETKLASGHNDNLNFDMLFKRVLSANTFDSNFVMHHGADENTKLSIAQESKIFWKSKLDNKLKNSIEVSYPKFNIDFLLNADSANTRAQQYLDINLVSGEDIKANVKYDATGDDYDLVANVLYPGQTFKFSEVAKKVIADKWTFVTSFESQPQGRPAFKINADTDFMFKFDNYDTKSEILTKLSSTALQDPLTIHSKFAGRRDFYQATLKLAKPDHDLLNLETEFKQAIGNQPTSFSTKAFLINYFDGQLSETHTRLASNFKVDLNLIESGRRIIASSDLKRQQAGELFNFDGQIQWDADKDPSKSASVKSVTLYQARGGFVFDSKNTFKIEALERELNLKGKLSSDYLNGENSADLQFKNYEGQLHGIQLKTVNENRNKVKAQNIVVKIILPNRQPFEIDWKNRASNMDFANYLGEFISELKVNYEGNQDVHLLAELHSVLTNKWSISGLLEASGSAISERMRLDYKTELSSGRVLYGISSNYRGDASDILIEVDFDAWSVKKTLDYKYTFKTPYTSTIKSLDGSGKYAYLFNSWTSFEIIETGLVTINGNNSNSWELGASFLQNDFKGKYNVNSEGKSLFSFGLAGKATTKKISGVFKNKLSQGSDSELTFDIDRPNAVPNPSLNLKLNINTNRVEYGQLSYRLNLKSFSNHEIFEASFRGRSPFDRLTLASKVEFTKLRKSFDAVFSTDRIGARKIFVLFSGPTAGKYNVESLIRWGEDGKTISTSGTLFQSGSNVDGTLTLDSPYYKADKWKVRVSRELAVTGRNALSFIVQSSDKDIGTVLIDYSRKQKDEDHSTHYNGSLAVKSHTFDFTGDFYTVDSLIRTTIEDGRQIKSLLTLGSTKFPVKLDLLGKATNLEDHFSFSFCNENYENCKKAEILLEKFDTTAKNGQIISFKSETTSQEQKGSTDRFIITTITEGQQFEHSTKFISTNNGDQELGYKIFRFIDQNTDGFEIDLPNSRKVAGVLAKKFSSDATELVLQTWLDKTRKPDDNLIVSFNSTALDGSETRDAGNEISLQVQHPSLTKDLLIKSRYELKNGDISTTSTELLMDIFKPNQELIITFQSARDFSRDSIGVYSYDFNVNSNGQGIQFEIHSDIRKTDEDLATNSKLVYLNREKVLRNYVLDLDYGYNRRTFQLTGPSGRIISYLSNYNFQLIPGTTTFDAYEVRREIFLPGMADTRIFQNKVSFVFPPKVDIKMFTVSSPPGQYEEFQFGFKNTQEFVASFDEHGRNGQKKLVDFDIALNNSRLLFVKADWNKENIKQYLTKGQVRIQDTSTRFKIMSKESSEYVASEIEHLSSKLRDSLPDFKPFAESFKKQLIDLKIDVESADNWENFGHYFEFALNILGTDSKAVKISLTSFSDYTTKLYSSFLDYMQELPERFYSFFQTFIPSFIKNVQIGLSKALDAIVETFNFTISSLIKTFDKISQLSTSNYFSTSLADTTQGIGKLWNEALSQAIEFSAKLWSNLKIVLESEYVTNYTKKLATRYEHIMAEFIENFKGQIDQLRESLFKLLPTDNAQIQEFLQKVVEYVELKTRSGSSGADKDKVEELHKEIYAKFVEAVKGIAAKIFTVDLKNGLIIAQVPLPAPVKSLTDIDQLFDSLPSYSIPKIKLPSQNYLNYYNTFNYQSLFGYESDGENGFSFTDVLPPFEGYGLLLGSQYYRTFDGKFYHFEGKCQYLLASDFVDKNFTIVVDYKKDSRSEVQKAIIVTDHSNTISIEPNSAVFVNGKSAKIPSIIGQFQITSDKNWIRLTAARGFEVACSTQKDVCVVGLDGFYLGKTGGLLGTFNNEHFDDLKTPSGNISDTFEELASTWKLDRQCQEEPIPIHTAVRTVETIHKCHGAFQLRSSPLSSCFETVDASNYEHICTSLVTEEGYDTARSVCTAAHGYQIACKHANIPVQLNSLC